MGFDIKKIRMDGLCMRLLQLIFFHTCRIYGSRTFLISEKLNIHPSPKIDTSYTILITTDQTSTIPELSLDSSNLTSPNKYINDNPGTIVTGDTTLSFCRNDITTVRDTLYVGTYASNISTIDYLPSYDFWELIKYTCQQLRIFVRKRNPPVSFHISVPLVLYSKSTEVTTIIRVDDIASGLIVIDTSEGDIYTQLPNGLELQSYLNLEEGQTIQCLFVCKNQHRAIITKNEKVTIIYDELIIPPKSSRMLYFQCVQNGFIIY